MVKFNKKVFVSFKKQLNSHPLPCRSLTQWPGRAAETRCFVATYPWRANPYPTAGGPAPSAWRHLIIGSGVPGVLPGAGLLQGQHVQWERLPPSKRWLCQGLPTLPSQVKRNTIKCRRSFPPNFHVQQLQIARYLFWACSFSSCFYLYKTFVVENFKPKLEDSVDDTKPASPFIMLLLSNDL